MPDRPDYAALTRGQIALLDRINSGGAGLDALNQLVRLAQDVLGGRGAGFAEYSPYSRLLRASPWREDMKRKLGSGASSNGSSRNP